MSCFRQCKSIFNKLPHHHKHAVKTFARRTFTDSSWRRPAHRTFQIVGAAAFGGSMLIGFGYIVVFADSGGEQKKKLVILGSGWGAVSLIKSLAPGKFDVSVVSPQNYFLFTPLLPSVTVGTVEGRSITEPIRKILLKKHKDGAKFYEAECTRVDTKENKIVCTDSTDIVGSHQEFSLDYDYLVVAVGAQTATYNIPGISENAYYLKDVEHARVIRKNIIDSFETALVPGQPEEEVKRLLSFVVVGGGPTGVEFAAELRDWIKGDLVKVYPPELVNQSQITLVDGLNKILNTYSEEISRYTEENFKKEGISIITNAFVSRLDNDTLHYKDANTKEAHSMPYGMCVWCAGIGARPITRQIQGELPEQNNRMGLITDHFMKVKNSHNIFSLGDCSTVQFKKFAEYVEELCHDQGVTADMAEVSTNDFADIVKLGKHKFPHLMHRFKELERFVREADCSNDESRVVSFHKRGDEGEEVISLERLMELANQVDTKQTALPPTAQVAAQEGKYLGKLLNTHAVDVIDGSTDGIAPFSYTHLGSFAYVGNERAVLELPVIGSLKGLSTMWLWRGIYASECVSFRMRAFVCFDWMKRAIFGRDTSQI